MIDCDYFLKKFFQNKKLEMFNYIKDFLERKIISAKLKYLKNK